MSDNTIGKKMNNEDSSLMNVPPPLPISEKALKIHKKLVDVLNFLLKIKPKTPLDLEFTQNYSEAMFLFEQYQDAVVSDTDYKISCNKGCSKCCFHWVEDVYSFEIARICDYVDEHYPDSIDKISKLFLEDIEHLQSLDRHVTEVLKKNQKDTKIDDMDAEDLLLTSFYKLRRPCAFLNDDGSCGIYSVRPITCRIYVSFSDPKYCDPNYITDPEIRTYLLDMEENASEILDKLHELYDIYDGDMGLRSGVLKGFVQDYNVKI